MNIVDLFSKASEGLTAGKAFGPVIEQNGCTVIPVAWVAGGGGGGSGEGPSEAPSGSGTGGGFGGVMWPLGVYVVKDGNARFVPAVDATRIALAGIAIAKLAMKMRALRRGRIRG